MLEPPQLGGSIEEWLLTLHLPQYVSFFQEARFQVVEDCRGLTDERLLELQVIPTGHRKRILRSLEALGLKQEGGEKGKSEQESQESDGDQRKPPLYPRHIFLKDRNRGASYQHNQPKENREYNLEGSQSLPAGAGLALDPEKLPDRCHVILPVPASRNLQLIQTSVSSCTSVPASMLSSSSNESLPTSEISSDWEVSSGEQCHCNFDSLLPVLSEDQEHFDGEMVENSIYEAQPAGPRPTRSYRLRHRPVPEIPCETAMNRKKPKEKRSPPTQTVPDGDGYSTVDMSASMLPRASMDKAFALTPDTAPVGSVTPGPENESMIMVECDLYSQTVKSRGTVTESTQPDISPYACFYGGPKQQVLKVGWLDKLSPQG
ncbi:hypothetical protein XENOCAPTIV_014924 [Xenoophorus captivus]|uniref:SAM domain-containing protein n=1 Tax=Xenoophorus captivus TaxID=1517983 RepID=A0ABV0R3S3_9TELE